MYSPITPWLVKARQKEMMDEARKRRLITAARTDRCPRRAWFFGLAGNVLIAAGLALQRMFDPADCHNAESVL